MISHHRGRDRRARKTPKAERKDDLTRAFARTAPVVSAKVYSNEFQAVTGEYLESFAIRSAEAQLKTLNTRFANKTFAMHVRMKKSTGVYEGQVLVNIASLEKPYSPIEVMFNKKAKND